MGGGRLSLLRAVLVIAVVCTHAESSSGQAEDPGLRNRFLKGVTQAAAKLDGLSFRAKCTVTSRNLTVSEATRASFAKRHQAPFQETVSEFECAIRGTLSLKRSKDRNGIERLMVRNRSYAFSIARAAHNRPPTLQFLEQMERDPSIDSKIAGVEKEAKGIVFAAYRLWGIPLSQIIQNRDFKIQRVYLVPSEGRELVKVDFHHTVNEPQSDQHFTITDGYVICDPVNQWAVTEYGGVYESHINNTTAKQTWKQEYGEPIGGMPIATKVDARLELSNDPGSTIQMVFLTEISSSDEVPEAEFSLSHYGLPEPKFRSGWFGMWFWYLLGAVASLVAAWVYLKRRRAWA